MRMEHRPRFQSIAFLVVLGMTAGGAPALSHDGSRTASTRGFFRFLAKLQDSQPSGLVPLSETTPRFTTTYGSAMAARAFTEVGAFSRARRVFDVLAAQADVCPACPCQGGLQQYRDAATGGADSSAWTNDFWIGDNAHLLAALRTWTRRTGDSRYAGFMSRLETWFQCVEELTPDPGIYSGFRKDGSLMAFRHAEGSLDTLGAVGAENVRRSTKAWIDEAVWIPGDVCYERGPENRANLPTDHVSWGIPALGSEYRCLLRHAEALNLRRLDRQTVEVFDREPGSYWQVQRQDERSSIVIALRPEPHGQGHDLAVTYRMAAGDHWFLLRRERDVDFEATRGFRYEIMLEGDGSGHQFEVKLYNKSGQVYWHHFPMDFSGWRRLEIPYDQFKDFGDNRGVPLGRVGRIEFALNTGGRGGEGEFHIGRVRRSDISQPPGPPVEGFSAFESESNWIFVEGTAQMAAAYCVAGERVRWRQLLSGMLALAQPAFGGTTAGLPAFVTGAIDGGDPNAVTTAWWIIASRCGSAF